MIAEALVGDAKHFLGAFVDLIYPPVCPACQCEIHGHDSPICNHCLESFVEIFEPFCGLCGAPIKISEKVQKKCNNCPEGKIYFDSARSIFDYSDDRIKNIVHALKFHFQTNLADFMGEYLINGFDDYYKGEHFDAIIPVPLHKSRLRSREFNQAALLAQKLSAKTDIPIQNKVVIRTKKSAPQTTLTPEDRRKNVVGAFTVSQNHELKDLSFLIIDDVFTTGSTVNEVCSALKNGGAKYTPVLTLARAFIHK